MIPVVWYQDFDPDGARHTFWDHTFLGDVLDRRAWRPVAAVEYRHVASFDDLTAADRGAVVVVPARQHATPELVGRLVGRLRRLTWSLVILTGDEGGEFPAEDLPVGERRRLWVMTPHPDRPAHRAADGYMPNGYAPGILDVLGTITDGGERPVPWGFAGQVTHPHRREMVDAFTEHLPGGDVVETDRFAEGVDRDAYTRLLASVKVAPAPGGPVHPDTFRLYEALEAGAVPIVDRGYLDGNVWPMILGDVPFPVISNWASDGLTAARRLIDRPTRWIHDAGACQAWWGRRKRTVAYELDRQVVDIAGGGRPEVTLADQVTAIIPTSPVAAHPATDVLEATVESVRERLGADVEILIGADGVRPEQQHLGAAYSEYLRRVAWLAAHRWSNVAVFRLERWGHQAAVTAALAAEVHTPCVAFVEHDTPLVGDIPFGAIVDLIGTGRANVVRLYHEATIHPDHEHLMVDDEPGWYGQVQARRTMQWSQRPHVAATDFYRTLLGRYFTEDARTMIEDVVHGVVSSSWTDRGQRGWWDWRLLIYEPDDGTDIKRSTHLDWRGDTPKWAMRPDYPGGRVPPGAPKRR